MPPFFFKLLGLPKWAKVGLGIAAFALGALLWLHFHDKGVIRNHEAKVTEAVTVATTAANSEAAKATASTSATIEAGNERARDAAAKSSDPLKAGLDALK